jgi:16S rRNA C967 or C1407 C5-methylase (RsmB/RsmF family)
LEEEENAGVVESIRKEFPELVWEGTRQALPFRDQMDGSFAAMFRKV